MTRSTSCSTRALHAVRPVWSALALVAFVSARSASSDRTASQSSNPATSQNAELSESQNSGTAKSPGTQHAQSPSSGAAAPATTPTVAVPITAAITRAEIEAHVRFLASDELRGRMTGSAEAEKAARYLARVLELEHVEPAGDDGTFLQAVPLERTRATAAPELALRTRTGESIAAVASRDFEVFGAVDARDLRFVVVASEAEMPKSADTKVALFLDAPTSSKRRQWLDKAGLGSGEGFGLLVQPGSTKPRAEERFDARASDPHRKSTAPRRRPSLTLHGSLLERARKGEIESVTLASHVANESVTAYNVLGRVRGHGTKDHPELASQAIVVSAHYDHLGGDDAHEAPAAPSPGAEATAHAGDASKSAEQDHIFNGADDDASGCAAILEIAGAFAGAPAPARTLIFLFATGEEIGLLGTDEYLDHPAIPLDRTIANLNFEMIGRPDPLVGGAGVLWLTGFEKTNLGAAFQSAGLAIKVDPRPEQHFYERSDNIAFVRRGIVGQTFSTFNLHTDYHRVTDEADRLDYAHMESCTQAGYRAVKLVADGSVAPEWAEGKKPAAGK
jgi:hypothetical protein